MMNYDFFQSYASCRSDAILNFTINVMCNEHAHDRNLICDDSHFEIVARTDPEHIPAPGVSLIIEKVICCTQMKSWKLALGDLVRAAFSTRCSAHIYVCQNLVYFVKAL